MAFGVNEGSSCETVAGHLALSEPHGTCLFPARVHGVSPAPLYMTIFLIMHHLLPPLGG